MKVHYYYPYPANDGKHKYLLLLNQKRKYILDRLTPLILQNIKTKLDVKDILKDMRKTNLNFGINQE